MSSTSTVKRRPHPEHARETRVMFRRYLTVWLWACLAWACGSEPEAPREPKFDDPTPLRYKPCDRAEKVGDFSVELTSLYTAVSGSVAAAVVPADVPELVQELGPCRLERQRNLFCDPGCTGGFTCGEQGQCVPYPENLDVGDVSVWGLVAPVHMEPDGQSRRYWNTELPHPGFVQGGDIHLQASGGSARPFTLRGLGEAALTALEAKLELESEKPLNVSWAPASTGPGPQHVLFTLNIDQHGVTPLTVTCDVEDTGVLTVPRELIRALFAAGPSGFPSAKLVRRSADSLSLEQGCVEFGVRTSVDLRVNVSGHMPCTRDEDCLAGDQCDLARGACQ